MKDERSSWRSIPQPLSKPAITPIAQQRRRFVLTKRIVLSLSVLVAVFCAGAAVIYLRAHSKTFAPYAQEQDHTQIVFFSDGQLTSGWFDDQFPSLRRKKLLSIDIVGLQRLLLNSPQVLSAQIERNFPSTLKVTLHERAPLGRIRLKLNGKTETHYIGRDGVFFTSNTYRPSATLPYLSGAAVRQVEGQISPLSGAELLSCILDGLKEKFPELSVQINQINLSDWVFPVCGQTSVVLKTRSNAQFRFGPSQISTQLDRLGETLKLVSQEKRNLSGLLIDLTYEDKVTIVDMHSSKGGAR